MGPKAHVFLQLFDANGRSGFLEHGEPWGALYGDGSKPCTPVVHTKIAGIYGCSSH